MIILGIDAAYNQFRGINGSMNHSFFCKELNERCYGMSYEGVYEEFGNTIKRIYDGFCPESDRKIMEVLYKRQRLLKQITKKPYRKKVKNNG